VFSLGVVLWEGLTGKRLFGDRDAAARKAHILEGVIEPPSKATPGLPVALDAIVLRALERKPDDRFQTTRELAASLTEFGLANRLLADDVDLGKELRRLFPAGVPATALDFRGLTRATPIDAVPQDVLPPEQLARSSDTGPTPVAIESGDILPSSAPSSASDLTAAKITDVMPAQRAILDSPPDVAEVPSVTEVPTEPERLRPELPAEVSVQPAPPVKGGRGWQATTAVAMGLALLAGGFAWRRQHPSPAATPAPPATITPAEIPAPATPSPATRPSVERVTPSPLPGEPGERAGLRGPQVTPTKEPSPTPPAVHHPIPPRHHPKPGTLAVIAVRPWVQVFVDGTSRGYSPAPAIPITAGRHKITLSNDEAHLSRTFSVVVPEAGRVVFRGDAKTLQPAF
jgi:serine/threonine-protein kinase